MKKRNLFLLPLLVLGSTGLTSLMTSCKDDPIVEPGPEEPGPEEPGPEEPVVVAPTSIAFAEDSLELKVGNSVFLPAVTVLPENATDKSFTVTNSNEAAVKLVKDGNNYGLEGVAPGDAVITVASVANPELTDTLNVHVPEVALPTPVSATIAELNAKTADDTKNLYEVTGVVSWIKDKSNDAYGNLRLSTDDGSEDILVYGSTKDASSIAYDASYKNLVFTNPKDFVTGGLASEIDVGDVITMVCVYKYFSNTTPEIMGYLKPDSIVKSETRPNYSASVEVTKVGELGGATLSKTENICLGEELTLTVDIPTDYEAVVKVNGAELVAESVGVYKFTASFVNAVEVSFVEPAVPEGDVAYEMNTVFADVSFDAYGPYSTTKAGNTWDFSNGGKSKPNSSDVITEAFPMIVSKNGTTTDSYLTISLKYDVVGIDVVSYAWGNNGCNVVCTIETSVDGGTTWVALSNEGSSYTMTDGTHTKVNMSGNFDSTKLVRIHINTTADTNKKKKNNRLCIEKITFTYPTAA